MLSCFEFLFKLHFSCFSSKTFSKGFSWEVLSMHIVVTLDIVSDVLRVLRVEHPDYPCCDHFKTVSKDNLISFFFCERPTNWGER